jgi:hypothetical protein
VPVPLPVVPVPESIEEQEHLESEQPPPVVPAPDSIEVRENPDATVRLPKPPPLVPAPDSVEEQEDPDSEQPQPKPSAVVKEQEGLDVEKLLPKPPGDVRAPISLRKLGVLLIFLVLLISLGIGASFLSRARNHPTAYSATSASSASTPTSTPVASSYSTLAGIYTGTIYDLTVNASTSMSLTGIQQNQGSFSGYLGLGPKMKGSGLFRGTIDITKHLQFTVTDAAGNATLFFEGAMQSATSLSGDYYQCSPGPIQGGKCSQAPGVFGIWNVDRA